MIVQLYKSASSSIPLTASGSADLQSLQSERGIVLAWHRADSVDNEKRVSPIYWAVVLSTLRYSISEVGDLIRFGTPEPRVTVILH